jgi:hypothetical protein
MMQEIMIIMIERDTNPRGVSESSDFREFILFIIGLISFSHVIL